MLGVPSGGRRTSLDMWDEVGTARAMRGLQTGPFLGEVGRFICPTLEAQQTPT